MLGYMLIRENDKKIVTNILWSVVEYGARLITSLVISAALTRALGVEQFGVFQYSQSIVLMFMAISYIGGAEVLIPRLVGADLGVQKRLLADSFALRVIFCLLAYFSLLIYALWFEGVGNIGLLGIMGLTILFAESFSIITMWLQSRTDVKIRSLLVAAVLALKAAIVFALFRSGLSNPNAYAYIWVGEAIALSVGLGFIYYIKIGTIYLRFNLQAIRDLIRVSLPFFSGVLLSVVFLRLDLVMLRHLGSSYELGLYASAVQLLQAVTAFSAILVMSMSPIMVYRHTDEQLIKKGVLKIVVIVTLFASLAAGVSTWLAPMLLPRLFGESYVNAVPILVALVWCSILLFVDNALNIYIIKTKRGKLFAAKWVASITASLIVYFYAIPKYQAFGAVAGYLVGYTVAALLGFFYLYAANGKACAS